MLTSVAPGTVAGPDALDGRGQVSVARLRLGAVCLGIALLVLAQSAGSPAADTKLDLVVDPASFLRRSLTLWDPLGGAGQIPDQAYGYLFPMGPFFLLAKALSVPAWIAQRTWESAILIAAFLGVVRLARLLGTERFWPRVAAGLAYALAPRMLMEFGVISSELLPVAVLPWMLIPLVGGQQRSARRSAALAALPLLFAGGINASATLAVLPVPLLWIATRPPGPRRRALAGWFAIAVGLSCCWWAIPLLLLGKYSSPFLGWIESSAVTTSPTSLVASLRGVDHWQAYLGPGEWPGGWILAVAPGAILATTAVAAIGLVGIARRATPHRAFLLASLGAGLVLVTMGHAASVGPVFAGSVRTWLDGPLAAFRNVHKFDPVIRLPLALGFGYAMGALPSRVPRLTPVRARGAVLQVRALALVLVALVGVGAVAITPALAGRVVPQTRSVNEPSWWRDVAAWLDRHSAAGRALVVPGAAQPTYVWGSPRDDALQPVAESAWTVRDAAPMAQPGYVRLLDAVQTRLAQGIPDQDLSALLARAGIAYVVVRNDLDAAASKATPLAYVRATLESSPGLRPAATFGPDLIARSDPDRLVDLGISRPAGAVQVYSVAGATGPVAIMPTAGAVQSTGSGDELATLLDRGLARPGTPVILGANSSSYRAGLDVVTDGIRRREVSFGATGAGSSTMTADQPFRAERRVHDYLPDGHGPMSTIRYLGIADVSASSSGSDASAIANRTVANSPWAAIDGDPVTAWRSGGIHATGEWWQVRFSRAISLSRVTISFATHLPSYPTRLRVTTSAGTRDVDVAPDPLAQQIDVPPGRTDHLRITVLSTQNGQRLGSFGLAGVIIPGISPSRTLELGAVGRPDVLAFDVAPGARPECLTVSGRAACDPSFESAGEEDASLDRTFTLSGAATFALAADVRLVPGSGLDAALDAGRPERAETSSVDAADPRERAGAAVDGRPDTSWVAAAGDVTPTLTVRFSRARTVRGLTLRTDAKAPAARPTRVEIRIGGQTWVRAVPPGGHVVIPTVRRASSVQIRVLQSTVRQTVSSVTGAARLLPVGISEVRLDGAPPNRARSVVAVPCSAGLGAWVDRTFVPLSVRASESQVLAGDALLAVPCGSDRFALAAGTHRVQLARGPLGAPAALTLTRVGAPLPVGASADGTSARATTWQASDRSISVDSPVQSVLVVHENANRGWQASLAGHRLQEVTVDGWQQGWLLPAGSQGTVHLRFVPQSSFDAGLIVGAVAIVLLIALALLPARRRRRDTPTADRRFGRIVCVVGTVLLATGLAGVAGSVVAVAALCARPVVKRLPAWTVAVPLMLAGVLEALEPTGTANALADSSVDQLLCIASVVLVAVRVAPRHGRENRRSTGRSSPNQETAATATDDVAVST
jgi:arabinofuranan 3-O-arabinosyltransferase